MASIATVTVRDFAILDAKIPPPISIWLSSQPPKISPFALVSAGIARGRVQRTPRGPPPGFSGARTAWGSGLSVVPAVEPKKALLNHPPPPPPPTPPPNFHP